MVVFVRPWYIADPARLAQLKVDIGREYPDLRVDVDRGAVFIRGRLAIWDQQRLVELDAFFIEVEIPDDFPSVSPLVRETGGRLPKIADRHFYPRDGTACLYVPDESYWFLQPRSPIVDFIRGPVESFFFSQAYFEVTGGWPFGERAHGVLGRAEFYTEILGTSDTEVHQRFLVMLLADRVYTHVRCYCGSGRPLGRCHNTTLVKYRARIDRKAALQSYAAIKALNDNPPGSTPVEVGKFVTTDGETPPQRPRLDALAASRPTSPEDRRASHHRSRSI